MSVASLERSAVERFSERTLQIINDAALALMMSIGHRTGLFDAMADGDPRTLSSLAAKAKLNERYVREWLGAMVTGGIVVHEPSTDTFRLPSEHAACLTRAASPNNMAVTTQWISVLGAAEDYVVEAFHHGRGVPYNAYKRFHAVMEEESRQTVVDGLMTQILPWVDGLVERLESGIDVLDIACGSGTALVLMAERFPRSRFTGIDISAEAIASGRATAMERGIQNVTLLQADAAALWIEKTFHLITAFDAIHDQARPQQVLERVHDALRSDGIFLMQDIGGRTRLADNMSNPLAPFNYTISCMHCMSVSLSGGGPGLGAMWGKEKALEMLAAAGFINLRVDTLPHDPINYYYLAVKGA